MKLIQQGAEAKILLDEENSLIIKDRIKKSYRIKELDEKIRKQRTRSEIKLLEKASKIIPVPSPFPLKEFNKIEMPFINGEKLSETLDSFPLEKQKEILRQVGEQIAKLHGADIIHGDLTTSNMIYKENQGSPYQPLLLLDDEQRLKRGDNNFQIFFIDFGLGFISKKIEDKAVDLHLLKQALEARHYKNWKLLFDEVVMGYDSYKEADKVLERLKAVEKRGRYKEH